MRFRTLIGWITDTLSECTPVTLFLKPSKDSRIYCCCCYTVTQSAHTLREGDPTIQKYWIHIHTEYRYTHRISIYTQNIDIHTGYRYTHRISRARRWPLRIWINLSLIESGKQFTRLKSSRKRLIEYLAKGWKFIEEKFVSNYFFMRQVILKSIQMSFSSMNIISIISL